MKKVYFLISLFILLGAIFFFLHKPIIAANPMKTATKPAVLNKAKVKLGRAIILGGKITVKGEKTLTVSKDDKTYTVNIDTKTQLRRKFWGKATLEEMQVNDIVSVHGKWTDDTQTIIQAVLIRDLSIQKRYGVFFGTVQSPVSDDTMVIQTVARGTQTVKLSSKTKYTDRTGKTIKQSDIIAGHRVRVKGLWDSANNIITEVTQVKDFSLPVKPTSKVSPTATK